MVWDNEGIIYFIAQFSDNYYINKEAFYEPIWVKIGFTQYDPEKRLAQLQTGNPHSLLIIAYFDGWQTDEEKLHCFFKEFRSPVGNEWFHIPFCFLYDVE